MTIADTVIYGIGMAVTQPAGTGPVRGFDLAKLQRIESAAIAIAGGRIMAVGPEVELRRIVKTDVDTEYIDAGGGLAFPGLVDCHSHPVFGGDRAFEFELRARGADYEELHAAGGGINYTVRETRDALASGSIDERVATHARWMLEAGTTFTEVKSGYGLNIDAELDSLRAAKRVFDATPVGYRGTILAAHTVPFDWDSDSGAFVDQIAIPAVQAAAEEGLATAADIFLERGSFGPVESERYLRAAKDAGLMLRLHSDQFTDQGGVGIALELGARSVDHLESIDPTDDRIGQLGRSSVAAVLLPLSSLFLRRPYAPGRALVDAGAIVALASDFNPGSSYGESLTLAMTLACTGCGLTPGEALSACTANAAWVLGVDDLAGRLAVGRPANIVLSEHPDERHLAYHAGNAGLRAVWVQGTRVL